MALPGHQRIARTATVPKNPPLGLRIMCDLCDEWTVDHNRNGVKRQGLKVKYRNRLTKEAGFSYDDSLIAVESVQRAKMS
jgi:hypothetical protein